jgi:predicted porin
MKKTLIAMAVASIASTPVMAKDHKAAQVFGEMKYETGIYDGNGEHSVRGTRFGVKGSSDLGNGLTGKYVIMGNIGATPGGSLGLNENNYIAIAGGFGEIRGGRADTATKEAIKPFRAFTDTIADELFAKPAQWTRADGWHYSKKIDNMKLFVTYSPNGEEMNSTLDVSLTYKVGSIYFAAAAQSVGEKATNVKGTNTSVGAKYSASNFTVGALYQKLEAKLNGSGYPSGNIDDHQITIPVTFKISNKLQMNFAAVMTEDNTDFAVGPEYFFDKKTKAFLNVTTGDQTDAKRGATGFGFGMSRKF